MNNEDGIFRILTQTPFNIVLEKVKEASYEDLSTEDLAKQFLKSYGWTIDEFNKMCNKRSNLRD